MTDQWSTGIYIWNFILKNLDVGIWRGADYDGDVHFGQFEL